LQPFATTATNDQALPRISSNKQVRVLCYSFFSLIKLNKNLFVVLRYRGHSEIIQEIVSRKLKIAEIDISQHPEKGSNTIYQFDSFYILKTINFLQIVDQILTEMENYVVQKLHEIHRSYAKYISQPYPHTDIQC